MSDNQGWHGRRDQGDAMRDRRGGRRARPAARHRARPEVLLLEDRRLLTLTITVDNPTDTGQGTLRDAIQQADLAPASVGSVQIDFNLTGPATIGLTDGQLELSNTAVPIAIDGPGAGDLAVDAGGNSRVFQIDPGVTASISGTTISGGSASGGGDVENLGALTLTGVTLGGGSAYWGGGGLANYGTATLVDCTVTGNTGGGLLNGYDASMVVEGGTIAGNSGRYSGLSNGYGSVSLTGTTISGNSGSSSIDNWSGTMTMNDCTISGNSDPSAGLGLVNMAGGTTLDDSTVEDFPGGGILSFGGAVHATGTTIRGNGGHGGLVNGWFSNTVLSDCRITDNTTSGLDTFDGGGVTNFGISLGMDDCTIAFNSAAARGGGLVNLSPATLNGCTFTGNTAVDGGGIFNGGTLTATGVSLVNNSAADGGGIDNTGTLTLSGTPIVHNAASHDGGGLLNTGTATLTDCHLAANSAGSDGGGVFNGGIAALTDCTVTGNSAAVGGGIDEAPAGTLTLVRTSVKGNRGGDTVGG